MLTDVLGKTDMRCTNVHIHACQMFQYYDMQNLSLLNIILDCCVSFLVVLSLK